MKRNPISKQLRQSVYNKYNGHCAYCGCEITFKEMQVDHLNSFYNNGENQSLDNLMPACRACNFYKSTLTVDKFRQQLGLLKQRLNNQFIYKLARKYNLIEEINKDIKFYFERKYVEEEN